MFGFGFNEGTIGLILEFFGFFLALSTFIFSTKQGEFFFFPQSFFSLLLCFSKISFFIWPLRDVKLEKEKLSIFTISLLLSEEVSKFLFTEVMLLFFSYKLLTRISREIIRLFKESNFLFMAYRAFHFYYIPCTSFVSLLLVFFIYIFYFFNICKFYEILLIFN